MFDKVISLMSTLFGTESPLTSIFLKNHPFSTEHAVFDAVDKLLKNVFLIFFLFILKYSWFTMLYQYLLCSTAKCYIYIYIYIYIYTHTHIYICIYTRIYLCIHTHVLFLCIIFHHGLSQKTVLYTV